MKTRVTNPNTDDAERYINRDITCCDSWLESFEAFYNDMGPCPEGYSLDRIDNDLGYSPENCRWASQITQPQNRGNFLTKSLHIMEELWFLKNGLGNWELNIQLYIREYIEVDFHLKRLYKRIHLRNKIEIKWRKA